MLGNFSYFFVDFFSNQLFQRILTGIPAECQTVNLDQWFRRSCCVKKENFTDDEQRLITIAF